MTTRLETLRKTHPKMDTPTNMRSSSTQTKLFCTEYKQGRKDGLDALKTRIAKLLDETKANQKRDTPSDEEVGDFLLDVINIVMTSK